MVSLTVALQVGSGCAASSNGWALEGISGALSVAASPAGLIDTGCVVTVGGALAGSLADPAASSSSMDAPTTARIPPM